MKESNTPLFHAVKYCAHECLEMLLAKGVDTGHVNGEGATILHWAARHGDLRVLEIMGRWGFSWVNVGKRDGMGRTTMQVLENRTGRPMGMKEAIAELANSVEDADSGEEESFFDAEDELAMGV